MKLFFLLILFFLFFPKISNAQFDNDLCTVDLLAPCLTPAYQSELFDYVLEEKIIDSTENCPIDSLKSNLSQEQINNFYDVCWDLVRDTYVAQMQTSCGGPNSCTVAIQTVETVVKPTFIKSLVEYLESTDSISPTNIPSTPTPMKAYIPTPTPTSTVSLEISGGASFHTSKCGLAAAGFQCCYPNLKEGAISLKGSFFDLFQGIWNTVQDFIKSNIDSYIGIGTQSMKDAAFQGGSNINLCPRSEEGHKKQRFVDLENSVWLDKIEDFDGNPDSKGQVQMSDNKELKDYSIFINGNSASGSPAGEDGLISAFFNQEILPTGGVEYQDKQYACFCVDPEKQRDETPESFLSLAENASLKNAANSFRTSSNQVSDLKNRVLSENDEGVGAREGAAKMCRNITDVDERVKCHECVSSDGANDLGGAWTAVGCIKADFSTTLQERLFPLFISFGGLISLGCIIYASFLLQTSMGEPEKITKAQELMTSCIAGLIMIIFSVFILRVIGVDILRLPGLNQEAVSPTATGTPTPTTTGTSTPGTPTPTTTPVPTITLAKYECGSSPKINEVYLIDFNNGGIEGPCLRLTISNNTYNLLDESINNNSMYKSNDNISKVRRCADNWNDCINQIILGEAVKAEVYLHSNSNTININESGVLTGEILDSITKIKIIQK